MRILKKLSKIFFIFFPIFFTKILLNANEPVDIWKIDKNKNKNLEVQKIDKNRDKEININKVAIQIEKENKIKIDNKIETNNIMLAGLYDPAENGLTIDMWSKSDGDQIRELFDKIKKKKLSNFSEKILDIALFTNSYIPENNISLNEFLDFKFDHLIHKKDFELIKKFISKNSNLKNTDKLVRFYVDYFLTRSELSKSCEIFEYTNNFSDEYLNNFKIYCLVNKQNNEQAQLLFDINSELSSIDSFFSKKFNVLMGFDKNNDELISEKNILYFHLSHITNKNFSYEPNMNTSNFIWKYLSSSNLLKKAETINIDDIDEIKLIEKAANEEIYEEIELLDLYKKFNFDFTQLYNPLESYENLPAYEGRALLYQRFLLSQDIEQKLLFASKLKSSFLKSNLNNLFNRELSKFLKDINSKDIPSNFTTFYNKYKEPEKVEQVKIKINNKVIHQSKLINYFLNKMSLTKTEKEANDMLKKIKKNKKYIVSKKDIILLESLKSDGVKINKKYENLYNLNLSIPPDINSMIVNGETGLVLLKLIDIIGEDKVEDLDLDSVSFISSIMNELKMIDLRNAFLLKVLPLKS